MYFFCLHQTKDVNGLPFEGDPTLSYQLVDKF